MVVDFICNHEFKNCIKLVHLVFWLDVHNVKIMESIISDVQSLRCEDISNDTVSFSILFGVGAATIIQIPEGWTLQRFS